MLWTECLCLPQIPMLKSNPQCDGRGGTSGIELSYGMKPSWMGLVNLKEEAGELAHTPSTIWGYSKKLCVCNPEEPSPQPNDAGMLSWTSSLHKCEKYNVSIVYKLPSLQYFVIAGQIDS